MALELFAIEDSITLQFNGLIRYGFFMPIIKKPHEMGFLSLGFPKFEKLIKIRYRQKNSIAGTTCAHTRIAVLLPAGCYLGKNLGGTQ